eukprot:4020528-Pleurochrysis_carterae.AAC.2
MPALRGQRRWQRCAANDSGAVRTATLANSGAGSALQPATAALAVRPATAALCRQRCRRCENSGDDRAAQAATTATLCKQRQQRSCAGGDDAGALQAATSAE